MKKTAIWTVIGLMFSLCRLNAEVQELKRVSYYPKNDQDYYFKPICSLAFSGDTFYGVENLSNRVHAFEFAFPQIKHVYEVGQPGQGPGDFTFPIGISIWGEDIAVKDSTSFSFFGKERNYISRFKTISSSSSFFFQDNKIYLLNPTPQQNHLIEVYLKDGKRILTIGNKFINVTKKAENELYAESKIYEGNIFSDGKSIYYLNSRFGQYFIYSPEGVGIKEGNLSDSFGERGSVVSKYNEATLIRQAKVSAVGYPRPLIYEAASLYKDKLYFMGSRYIPGKEEKTLLDIKIFNARRMAPINDYVISKQGFCRIDSFIVIEHKGILYLLLSISVINEGFYLELYEIPQ